MGNCSKCGKEIFGVSTLCPECESRYEYEYEYEKANKELNRFHLGYFILGYISSPLFYWIFLLNSKKRSKVKVRNLRNGAWIGVVIWLVIVTIRFLAGM